MSTTVQLGPWKGTEEWKRGSIIAWVLMWTYGLEVPIDWELPAGIEFLPEMHGDKPYEHGGIDWPMRAVWS